MMERVTVEILNPKDLPRAPGKRPTSPLHSAGERQPQG